jgi:hypothetical protein
LHQLLDLGDQRVAADLELLRAHVLRIHFHLSCSLCVLRNQRAFVASREWNKPTRGVGPPAAQRAM